MLHVRHTAGHPGAALLYASLLAILVATQPSLVAAAAAECQCLAVTSVVCGQDGNSYQSRCLAECQGVPVAAPGPCTATSGVGVMMAESFAAAAAADAGLAVAMATYALAPLTVRQLDRVAAAAAGVVQGFSDRALSTARLITAADMSRFSAKGLVLVGAMELATSFNPTVPDLPDDADYRPTEPYENFGATEAVATIDGLLYKPRSLSRHATIVAVAAAQVEAEAAAAAAAAAAAEAQQNSTFGTVTAKLAGLVALQPYVPADLTALSRVIGVTVDQAEDLTSTNLTAPDPGLTPDNSTNNSTGLGQDDGGQQEDNSDAGSNTPGRRRRRQLLLQQLQQQQRRRHLLKVFPPDNRIELVTRQRTLVRAVGRITFDLEDSSYFCSGAMVGRYTVLTAAHCVMSVDTPGLTASTWKFSPDHNIDGPDPRFGKSPAAAFHFDTRFWSSGKWWLWDIAVVVLQKPLGRKTGFFGVGYMPTGYAGSLDTAGYPADKPLWSFWWIPGGNRCTIKQADTNGTVMTHKCDTFKGQSGSPMWIPGTSTILSVMSWESSDVNGACAFNPFFFRFVRSRRASRPPLA